MTHSRRNFIRLASKYSLGGVVLSSLPLSAIAAMRKPVSANETLNLGLIGANGMGWANIRSLLKNSEADCIAICDVDENVVEKRKKDCKEITGKKPKGYGDYRKLLENKDIDAVMILTPHSTHSKMTIEALNEKKHIYVEKPLCISEAELNEIKDTLITIESNAKTQLEGPLLVVGYNRRFSPHVQKTINYLENRKDPLIINYRINAGYISPEHWVHDEKEGGSRIVGELCHFIDLVGYLTSSKVCKIYAERISGNNKTSLNSDNIAVTLKFTDGSIANLTYTASGDRGFSRERIEMFFDGNTIHIEDFKTTEIFFSGKKNNFRTSGQQMGYQEELQNFFVGDNILLFL